MKLCDRQKVMILLTILIILGVVAFLFGLLDLKALFATIIGDGFVAYLVYLLLNRQSSKPTKTEKPKIIIQKDSLRYNKYPYLLVFSNRRVAKMPNTVYAEITVENIEKIKANDCEVEITLENSITYRSKVLSSNSTKTPNPITTSVDANRTKGFHPLCLRLHTLEAFLPNHSEGVGAMTGTSVRHGSYEMSGIVIYDGMQSKATSLSEVKIPNDFLEKSIIPSDIQVRIDEGGFAVYLELFQGKIRTKFYGNNNDEDVKKIISNYLIHQIDDVFEDNGKLRRWALENGNIEIMAF